MNTIHKIASPEEGLRYLAERYGVPVPDDARLDPLPGEGRLSPALAVSGKRFPLLPWRQERRFAELKSMVRDGTLKDVSSVRVCRIEQAGTDLRLLLYRELDLLEWLLDSPVEYLYTVSSGPAANTVARLRCGVVCTVETAATLAPGAQILDKHEIIASKGVALDKVVDTQIQQNSVYVFAGQKEPDAFTDTDFELYGLTPPDTALVRCALEALRNPAAAEEMSRQDARLQKLTALALESAETGRKMIVEG